jgi:hypothetical protein
MNIRQLIGHVDTSRTCTECTSLCHRYCFFVESTTLLVPSHSHGTAKHTRNLPLSRITKFRYTRQPAPMAATSALQQIRGNLCLGVAELLAGVHSGVAELLLDTQKLVVLGCALRSAGGTGLDLASAQADDEVGNEAVLSLSRPTPSKQTLVPVVPSYILAQNACE